MADELALNETANTTVNSPSLEKMMPKYCTNVQVALLNNSHIVLSISSEASTFDPLKIKDLHHS